MQKFKLAFKFLNSKSKVEKTLIKVYNENTSDFKLDKRVNKLVQRFQQSDNSMYAESADLNIYEIYNKHLRNSKNWLPTLKLLYVGHQLINNIGSNFCKAFLSEYFEKISEQTKQKNDIENYVHTVLAANYYNFLIIYAKYYPDIQTHFTSDSQDLARGLLKGEYESIVQLCSFKNIIKYFTKVEECIEASSHMLKEYGPLAKITLLLFKDVIAIYNLIVRLLQPAINLIFNLKGGVALLLDELYSDIIQVTQKLKQLVSKSTLVPSHELPRINYFSFDADFNKQEELYILELKKAKAQQGYSKPEPYEAYKTRYQTLNPGKRLYKLNTKVDHLTKIELNPRDKDYYNLVSPDPSHLEEDFDNPRTENGELLPIHNGMILAETDQSYKDIRNPVQLEIQLNKNRRSQSPVDLLDPVENNQNFYDNNKNYYKNLKLQYDHRDDKPTSVIFTPTANHAAYQFPEDGNYEDFPQASLQKNQSNFIQHGTNDNQQPWDKRNMNFNLANL